MIPDHVLKMKLKFVGRLAAEQMGKSLLDERMLNSPLPQEANRKMPVFLPEVPFLNQNLCANIG